jgi:hypothetical protein
VLQATPEPPTEVDPAWVAVRRSRARGAAVDRWLVRLAFAVLAFAFAFVVAGLVTTARQVDRDRIEFDSSNPVAIDLAAGESIEIYMSSSISGALQFDFYPSDFTCTATSPDGEPAAIRGIDQRRRLDGGSTAWSIATVDASSDGLHTIDCGTTKAPLVLAHPGPIEDNEWLNVGGGLIVWWLAAWAAVVLVIQGATHVWELRAYRTPWWRHSRHEPADRPRFDARS